MPQKRLCIDYQALHDILTRVVKVNSKVQGVLTIVALSKIDGLHVMLSGSTVYSYVHCTLGYHYIVLSSKRERKSQKYHLV